MNDPISERNEAELIRRPNNNLFLAVVFILVGGALLVSNLTDFSLNNWWALFMLIPAGAILTNAWRDYQEIGRAHV